MIDGTRFGQIVIDKTIYHEDVLVLPGQVIPCWRRQRGHFLQIQDLADVLEAFDPQSVVVGTGQFGVMKVSQEVRDYFEEKGIPFHMAPTGKAVKIYNRFLGIHARVLGCFHINC